MTQRRLVLHGPSEDERVREQARRIGADPAGATERDVRLECLDGAAFAVVLIGRDGTEKARWEEPVDVEEVWARIDAMPMRRREVEGGA